MPYGCARQSEVPLFALAAQNLLSPAVLFFGLGLGASLCRSDLSVPEAVARFLALYLLMSIGFRGGTEVAHHGLTLSLLAAILAGILLSASMPFVAYAYLKRVAGLDSVNAAAVAAHYGSISAVTFVAVTSALVQLSIAFDGYMVAVAAAMETPAIFSALWLANKTKEDASDGIQSKDFFREVIFNGSIVTLLGAFAVGCITGERGMASLKPFLLDAFPGFLCLFLLDMGIIAGRGLREGRKLLSYPVIAFSWLMPVVGAALAAMLAKLIGLSVGSTAVLMTLGASASYIAVPAAMRLALPAANPAVALTLSLGLTFPFNLVLGIPIYIAAAQAHKVRVGMHTYRKKRVEIFIEAALLKRLTAVLDEAEVSGYSASALVAGSGRDGAWLSTGQIGPAEGMFVVWCILDDCRLDDVLQPVTKLISRQIGIVSVSDVEVVRNERFM